MNGNERCLTNVESWYVFLLDFFKMSFFWNIIVENFFTEEFKSLLHHSFRRIKDWFNFFKEKENFLFGYFSIFTVINHCDKISSIKICLRFSVVSAHKFKSLLNKFPDPVIRLTMLLSELLNNSLEDEIVMWIDIETFWVYIDCFDNVFLILWFLGDFFCFLIVYDSAAFWWIRKFIFIVK